MIIISDNTGNQIKNFRHFVLLSTKINVVYYICDFDPFRQGLRRYTFKERCDELRTLALPDMTEKIFLNIHGIKGEESPDMRAFLEYMATGVVHTPFVAAFDTEVRRIKADAKQKEKYMSLAMDYEVEMEERKAKARAEGRAEGERQRSRDIARRLLQRGLPLDLIAEDTGLTVEYVQALKQQ